MASTDATPPTVDSCKMDTSPAPAGRSTIAMADLTLRLLLFFTTLTSVVVMAWSKQTKRMDSPLLTDPIYFIAKFTYSPAMIYFVAALSVACLHSILSSVVSLFSISKKSPSARLLLSLAFIDTVMAGLVASATGAVASIAYVGLRGNSHIGWNKMCNIFDKFCQHVASSLIISLISSIILIFLVMVSTYSLYVKSQN